MSLTPTYWVIIPRPIRLEPKHPECGNTVRWKLWATLYTFKEIYVLFYECCECNGIYTRIFEGHSWEEIPKDILDFMENHVNEVH